MIYTIKSDGLSLSVDSFGCCLCSLKDNRDNEELIWQKDEKIWNCQDILIFPIIDMPDYKIDGQTYKCDTKHGFVRHMDFALKNHTANSLTLETVSTEETLKQFPFEFKLTATFLVVDRTFEAVYEIFNMSDGVMPYYFGLHPAFAAKNAKAEVIFEKECTPVLHLLSNKVVSDTRILPPLKSLVLSRQIFDKLQTVILSEYGNTEFCFKTESREYDIECDSPSLAFWSRSNGDYICIEPWWGMADTLNQPCELSQRKFVNLTADKKIFGWKVTVN